jgi:asparaginyl-tRNA synthetase
MIEPEMAFATLEDNMNLAEDYVKYCCQRVIDNNRSDLEAIDKYNEYVRKEAEKAQKGKKGANKEENTAAFKGKRMAEEAAVTRVANVASCEFKRISYTDAIELLLVAVANGVQFEKPVSWGIDLASEHERYLAEVEFKRPTIIFNYPRDIKAFYMRQNEDGKTVMAMDIVCPQIGELIGGSVREERFDRLVGRMKELSMDMSDLEWYLDLRRYGSVPHAGFGLGFERLVLFCTGMENIRDVIPFPRPPGGPIV